MRSLSKPFLLALLISLVFLFLACGGQKEHLFQGKTMGTTYNIKVVAGRFADMIAIKARVDERLAQINQSMSTYQADSEISRFNTTAVVDQSFQASPGFFQVVTLAHGIWEMTAGAFDPTVNPLVNLWGFGKDGPLKRIPSNAAVSEALKQVGFDRIELRQGGYLIKKQADITLDLAAIAKGYGVDQVASLLKELGYKNYLVEIGGEVYAAGSRVKNKPWRVGINRPQADASRDAVYKVIELQNRAMATSGDYRNFYEIEGQIYSHIIDPHTGHPLQNGVVSTSVIADNCTIADGLATALMVMGPERGIPLLDKMKGIEGVIIVRDPEGDLTNYYSKGLKDID